MIVWISINDLAKAEWFYKVDDDSYFFPGFARKYVADHGWKPTEHHYFGHRLHHLERYRCGHGQANLGPWLSVPACRMCLWPEPLPSILPGVSR